MFLRRDGAEALFMDGWNTTRSWALVKVGGSVSYEAREIQNAARALEELHMDTTTLLIIVVVLLLLFGGGWYGRGRWY